MLTRVIRLMLTVGNCLCRCCGDVAMLAKSCCGAGGDEMWWFGERVAFVGG